MNYLNLPHRTRPPLQRSKSYGVAEISKSAPEPIAQDTEITSSFFDWLPFRNKKPRTSTAKSETSQQASIIAQPTLPEHGVEGSSPRRKIEIYLITFNC